MAKRNNKIGTLNEIITGGFSGAAVSIRIFGKDCVGTVTGETVDTKSGMRFVWVKFEDIGNQLFPGNEPCRFVSGPRD